MSLGGSQARRIVLPAGLAAVVAIAGAALFWNAAEEAEEAASHPVVSRLADPKASRAVVWSVGDGATGRKKAYRMTKRMKRDADRVLYLGDVYPEGDPASYEKRFEKVYETLGRKTAPTIGNHEFEDRAKGYYPHWNGVFGAQIPPYYAFRIAGWQILSLNSEARHGPGSPQLAWIKKQAASGGTCRIAFFHRPPISAGTRGNYRDVEALRRALIGRARIMIYGHEHNTQRFRPRDGMTEMITGSGGAGRHEIDRRHPRLAYGLVGEVAATRFVLTSERATFQTISSAGQVLDRGRMSCKR